MSGKVPPYSPETLARRRAKVIEALDGGVLLHPAAPVLFRSRDTELRYRPDSELFYLTGWAEPGALAVLSGQVDGPGFVLFVAEKTARDQRWSGSGMTLADARERFGADEVLPAEEIGRRLPPLLEKPRVVYFRLGSDPGIQALLLRALNEARARGARTGSGPRAVVDPGEIINGLRARKDAEEILRIRDAAELTAASFRDIMHLVRSGMGEWEVEALLEGAFRKGGASGPAFPTIVGSGPRGCILHYSANDHRIEPGTLVLLDGGAELDLYAGDVTRTFPADGRFSPEQKAVYEIVLEAHAQALRAIRPGAPITAVHDAAAEALTVGLAELGVLSGSLEELLRERAWAPFFPHQTSHWLGLDVHDPGDYAREGCPAALEPGMVLTVEPGLYFPAGAGIDATVPSSFSGLGIRIEDDVLVREDGGENLTAALPVTVTDIESLMER